MYGPPQDCKGKATNDRQVCGNVFGLWVEISLLAMMSSAACLSLQVGRSLKTIIGIRLKARRCDCSFVVAVPVQTSVGKFKSVYMVLSARSVQTAATIGKGL
jgi:hypothetical protein